jgi:hypothetical protein
MSHGARRELIQVLRERYWKGTRFEKSLILNELVALTGHHRKHFIQIMARKPREKASEASPRARLYDEAVRAGLILLWEASDRVCSKRLKAMIPRLLDAMERHGQPAAMIPAWRMAPPRRPHCERLTAKSRTGLTRKRHGTVRIGFS